MAANKDLMSGHGWASLGIEDEMSSSPGLQIFGFTTLDPSLLLINPTQLPQKASNDREIWPCSINIYCLHACIGQMSDKMGNIVAEIVMWRTSGVFGELQWDQPISASRQRSPSHGQSSSPSQRPWQHPAATQSQLLFSGEEPPMKYAMAACLS